MAVPVRRGEWSVATDTELHHREEPLPHGRGRFSLRAAFRRPGPLPAATPRADHHRMRERVRAGDVCAAVRSGAGAVGRGPPRAVAREVTVDVGG
ncbi:hypothetical protein GCM10010421_22040 [Streptomyces glaucus]|uniref:Uncharacterized protein n=1 Tax=Streptomyces glaucus TaxID=284029 RepID=A0ABP5WT80_9ACTN